MKANENRIQDFMSKTGTNFAIPVYQRNYDWTHAQCRQLFNDIIRVGADDGEVAHFVGSIVNVHDDVYSASETTELTIIDGQQRLTTLTLLYAAIFRFAHSSGDMQLARQIHQTYLINEFAPENEKLKLKPTDGNKVALAQILDPSASLEISDYSQLMENFRFFHGLINQENLSTVRKGIAKLIFVDIALDRTKDHPQRIFESLNSTGLELSQSDLIRNYILMGLNRAEQDRLYKNFWKKIEENARIREPLNESKVSEFIRDYFTLMNKEIPNKNAVYETFKKKYPNPNSADLKDALVELRDFSYVYLKLLNPTHELDQEVRIELEYIKTLEINVAYPFLMKVYRDYDDHILSKNSFLLVLRLVQSFVWRRFIIGLPTSALNKIFMTLSDRIDPANYVGSLEKSLMQRTGSQRFPLDHEVTDMLRQRDMYSNAKPKTRNYFLDRIENHNNAERVDVSTLTIEHIFPQTPEVAWRSTMSDEDYDIIYKKYINTIGNLTLSGNNGKLGNKEFNKKKTMNHEGGEQGYEFSRLWLNRDLKILQTWGLKQVQDRADRIVERFLEVWPCPKVELNADERLEEVNIFEADDPTNKKLSYIVFYGNKINMLNVSTMYEEVIRQLIELQSISFLGTKLGEKIQLVSNREALRSPLVALGVYYFEGHLSSRNKFERIKVVLSELQLEDELLIKYA